MHRQQEARLLAAFRLLHSEEKEILVNFAESRAAKEIRSRPKLRLVAGISCPTNDTQFSGVSR